MKVAVLCYHKNAAALYPPEWLDQYRDSILRQSYIDFEIFEFNYGGGTERIFEHSYFESYRYPTFVHALNYLMDKVFSSGYDVAFNSNVDDWAHERWIETLLGDIKNGNDLVSSNFCLVKNDEIVKYHLFHELDIKGELNKFHNVVCHPSVGYTKKFWEHNRYNPDEMPIEDLALWRRAINNGMKFFINEQNLLFHRLHSQSVCQSNNK